eukprot:1420981-Prymnesium_polylepis.1
MPPVCVQCRHAIRASSGCVDREQHANMPTKISVFLRSGTPAQLQRQRIVPRSTAPCSACQSAEAGSTCRTTVVATQCRATKQV